MQVDIPGQKDRLQNDRREYNIRLKTLHLRQNLLENYEGRQKIDLAECIEYMHKVFFPHIEEQMALIAQELHKFGERCEVVISIVFIVILTNYTSSSANVPC